MKLQADTTKPIAFCEHLQLSALGVQPASIGFQVWHFLGNSEIGKGTDVICSR
jgi:hypothetical protein